MYKILYRNDNDGWYSDKSLEFNDFETAYNHYKDLKYQFHQVRLDKDDYCLLVHCN